MTVLNLKTFGLPATAGILDTARGWMAARAQAPKADPIVHEEPVPQPNPDCLDKVRYERILDHELDRQLLTEVEQEDSAMLARVRDALYAED